MFKFKHGPWPTCPSVMRMTRREWVGWAPVSPISPMGRCSARCCSGDRISVPDTTNVWCLFVTLAQGWQTMASRLQRDTRFARKMIALQLLPTDKKRGLIQPTPLHTRVSLPTFLRLFSLPPRSAWMVSQWVRARALVSSSKGRGAGKSDTQWLPKPRMLKRAPARKTQAQTITY
jgi:hypothetical protein